MHQIRFRRQETLNLLCALAIRDWEIGELHQMALSIPGDRVLYQLEEWPWHRTILFSGHEANYQIKLPRHRCTDDAVVPQCPIAVYTTKRSRAARKEVLAFLTQLASAP